jgi:hypothetical protein
VGVPTLHFKKFKIHILDGELHLCYIKTKKFESVFCKDE